MFVLDEADEMLSRGFKDQVPFNLYSSYNFSIY
jgi:superfamily II DNA/RNA helicase